MFRHASNAIASSPAALALGQYSLLVVSEATDLLVSSCGNTPACNYPSDKIKALSCKKTAL